MGGCVVLDRGFWRGAIWLLGIAVFLALATAHALDAGPGPGFSVLAKSPVRPLGTAPRLLASLSDFIQGGFGANVTSIAFILTEDAEGFAWGIGYGLFHLNGDAKTYNFTPANGPAFAHVARLLTNGIDDSMAIYYTSNLGGGAGSYGYESGLLGAKPDLLGNVTDSIALVIHDLHISHQGGQTWVYSNYTWQVWGHVLFAYFTPPTDPDGAYLFQRNSSNVSVQLRSPGTAILNWDGVNRTMAEGGERWYLNVTGIANGNHTFRVWTTDNISGTIDATELRTITLGYRLWAVEQVARAINPSLAVASGGAISACYGDYGGGIHYATRNSTGWHDAVVDTVSSGESGCSLVLDSRDREYISYGSLKFGFFDGASWRTETVATPAEGLWSSLALDPVSGDPMVAYYDPGARALFLANRSNGVWSREVVDSSGDTGWMPSLAVDAEGKPHIAYFDVTGRVDYAVRSGNLWTIQNIDSVGPIGGIRKISLAVDPTGSPKIAYGGGGSFFGTYGYGGLKYANWTGSHWQIQQVDAGPVSAVSLALDNLGNSRIAYTLVSGFPGLRDVRFAAWNRTWGIEILSSSADSSGISLHLTSGGSSIIAFPYWCCTDGTDQLSLDFAVRDIEPPLVQVNLSGTLGSAGWYLSPVEVRLNASDLLSGVASILYLVDRGTWEDYTGPFSIVTEGNHTVRYLASDGAGNTAPERYATFKLDATPPSSDLQLEASSGSAGWYVSNATVTLTATDATSGVHSISYRLDARDASSWQPYASPFTLHDGMHVLEYRATDEAGNVEPIHSRTLNVDTLAPKLSGFSPSSTVTTSRFVFSWKAADDGSGIARYEVSIDGGQFQSVGLTANISLTLSDGVHEIRVRAIDAAGNVAELAVILRVDANIFSFSGPYAGLPTILILGLAISASFIWMWVRQKRGKLSP